MPYRPHQHRWSSQPTGKIGANPVFFCMNAMMQSRDTQPPMSEVVSTGPLFNLIMSEACTRLIPFDRA